MSKNYRSICKELGDVFLSIESMNGKETASIFKQLSSCIQKEELGVIYFKEKIIEKLLKGPKEVIDRLAEEKLNSPEKYKITLEAVYDTIIALYPGFDVSNLCAYNNKGIFLQTDVGKKLKAEINEINGEASPSKKKGRKKRTIGIVDKEDLQDFEKYAKECIIGQDHAIEELVKSVKFIVTGVTDFRTILFVGKSGVGPLSRRTLVRPSPIPLEAPVTIAVRVVFMFVVPLKC